MAAVLVALAGNPNVGKSTIFNALTGLNQHTGNWPGKTVERKEGRLSLKGMAVTVVDLPGAYSLAARSLEEQIARDFIVRERPDLVVNVVDAANLERNLYMTAQLLETGVPLLVAVNMIDIAKSRGITIHTAALAAGLGVPVVALAAGRGEGLPALKAAMAERLAALPKHELAREVAV
ncbi:iron transporter FeoB [Chloroflexus islandicus]|uniref:Fe(2+) transporter FeoB n=1 Tax=Chloroflexus islandicus TaxID=1707952 RepID=A0A178MAA6_9CHLR|nr:FeoB small GTPase domain-containing protein [Chloroflexus islandicus]OAN45127.1 iron transporter FeoB [Chloroflexus islandicus]